MKELSIVSGKGGTGKTTITASLAFLWENKIMVDCDVDAANLHLLFHTKIVEEHKFFSGYKANIDKGKCIECGNCLTVCRFKAISEEISINELSCSGCGACMLVCPEKAISLGDNLAGKWFISQTNFGPLVHASLGIAQDNSGKLVAQIRSAAKNLTTSKQDFIIIDGPPGIGCPVMSAITGVDLVLIVTEPTLSGIHDLERLVKVVQGFNINCVICINKYDINQRLTDKIIQYSKDYNISIVGTIPFSKGVVEGACYFNKLSSTSSFFNILPNDIKSSLMNLHNNLAVHLQ